MCDELLPFVIGVGAVVKWVELLEGSVCMCAGRVSVVLGCAQW